MFIYGVSDHPRGLSTQLRLKQRVREDKNEMMKSQHRHPFPDSPSESERDDEGIGGSAAFYSSSSSSSTY